MIYAKTIVTGLNRFYRGHFQNAPNIKTFFGYAWHSSKRTRGVDLGVHVLILYFKMHSPSLKNNEISSATYATVRCRGASTSLSNRRNCYIWKWRWYTYWSLLEPGRAWRRCVCGNLIFGQIMCIKNGSWTWDFMHGVISLFRSINKKIIFYKFLFFYILSF